MSNIDDELYKLRYKRSELMKEIEELKKLVDLTSGGFGDNSFYKEKAEKTSNSYLKEYYNKNAMLIDINMEIDKLNNKKIIDYKLDEFTKKTKDISDELKDIEYINENEKNNISEHIILSKYAKIKTDGNIIVIYDENLMVNIMSDDLYRCTADAEEFNKNLRKYYNWKDIIKKHKLFKIKPLDEVEVKTGRCDFVVKNETVYVRFAGTVILSKNSGYVEEETIRKIIYS